MIAVRVIERIRQLERRTRPVDPEVQAVLRRRWEELPDGVRTPAQSLGRHAVGCEGTHGVFPKCNLACTPCYHSRDANRVRIDGGHTVAQVGEQMALFRQLRGPHAHVQLIGGEVSLLPPDDHARTLEVMRAHGREPMSFTHGDFDYDYLQRLAVGPDGRRRSRRISFAAHFDMLMFGRRGIARPENEAALNPYRQRFADMFATLRRQHGVRSFLAHNMTVTPANLDQVAGVIRDCRHMGYGMFSFQPAAFVGDERRWHHAYRDTSADNVWREIERGAGGTVDYGAFQFGDVRCNRTAYGYFVGDRWYPLLRSDDKDDVVVRDAFYRYFGGFGFGGMAPAVLLARIGRIVLAHPHLVVLALRWLRRSISRVGGVRALARQRVRPVTFVMHRFMDAADVAPAWDLMERGETSAEPRIRETQERLQACSYAMAHPETGRLVPACVQHSVLDPHENRELRKLLPLVDVRR